MSIAAPPSYTRSGREQRTPRRSELSRTLNAARDRLTARRGLSPRLLEALLVRHTQDLRSGTRFALPLALLFTAVLVMRDGAETGLSWLVGAILLSLPLARCAAERTPSLGAMRSAAPRFRALLLSHLAIGTAPALLFVGAWTAPDGASAALPVVLFAAGLAFLALAATSAFALPGAFAVGVAPSVAALVYAAFAAPADAFWLPALLLASVAPFAAVAVRLRRTVIAALRQATEREAMISELETARVGFEDARRRAEDANSAKSRFLATMSHELRTPLNAILGFSEVISNEILGPVGNPTYKEYAQDIHSSGQHLLELINEILDLSRVEAGRYTLNEETLELAPLVENAIGFVQMKADAKDIRIECDCEHDLPQVWGDPRALRQVTLNLLSNAVKFTPRGGLIRVRVGWTAGGGQYVSVRDNGPGIPADEIPTVLASFGQGASAIKSAEQGTGLGLPIVQALMQLHDGQFVLDSEPGEGTEVLAILPHARILEVMPAIPDYA